MSDRDRTMANPLRPGHLTRSEFIRLGGLTTALLWLPGSLVRVSRALGAEISSPFLNQGFPIGIFWPPPASESTAARYQQIADAGFTFVIGGNGVTNLMTVPAALDASESAGLDYLVTDAILQTRIRTGMGSIENRVQTIVATVGDHPATAGLNLFDEPSRGLFERVALARATLREAAPALLPYTNAHASYAGEDAWGTPTYEEYISSLIEVVRSPVLSFDHYPLLAGSAITDDYFLNWAVIARQRKLHTGSPIPSWAFIQSVDFTSPLGDRRRPTETELLWQVNVSLVYGAKGIMYFTYWTPAAQTFGQALVTRTGELTDLYHAAARTNDYLASVGNVLVGLTSQSTTHANESPVPQGAQPFTPNDFVAATRGDPVILGLFGGPKANERHLLVTNRSFGSSAVAILQLTRAVEAVFEFDPDNDDFHPVPLTGLNAFRVDLASGAAKLYLLRVKQS
jgi:hypothetical protein